MSVRILAITGASSGIGEGIAREFSAAGWRVVLTARSADKLQSLADEIGDAAVVAAEVTDADLPDRLADAARQRWGAEIDALVNNAGVMHAGDVDTLTDAQIDQTIDVDLRAAARLAYAFARRFKARQSGHIVNLSSISGLKTFPTLAIYDGVKHAIEALSDSLRMELAPAGVRVSTVAPGPVATGLFNHWSEADRSMLPDDKLAPADIARAIRFILEQPPGVNVARMLVVPAGAAI